MAIAACCHQGFDSLKQISLLAGNASTCIRPELELTAYSRYKQRVSHTLLQACADKAQARHNIIVVQGASGEDA